MNLYYGVVENNWDSEMLGRVQVRIVGKHTENRTDATQSDYMPVEDLPWAQTLQTGSTISNQGNFAIPLNGSVVIISFMDAEEQKPIIMGSVPKIPEELPDFTQGFSDPTGVNPTEESIGVSPISNYATGIPIPAGVEQKLNNLEQLVICIDNVWSEPPPPFAPVYPSNLVIQQGFQVLELDATPFAERINFQHIIGSFMELHPDGTTVRKAMGDDYIIVEGDQNILVKGGSNLTVRGILAGHNVDVTRNIEMKSVIGGIKLDASPVPGPPDSPTPGKMHIKGSVETKVESDVLLNLTAPLLINMNTDGILGIQAANAIITIDGLLIMTASLISLN